MDKILVLNAGSTTVKFQLYLMDDMFHEVLTGGVVERVGSQNAKMIVNLKDNQELSYELPILNHKTAMQTILDYLSKQYIKDTTELSAVAHRMGYGGKHNGSVIIDEEVIEELYKTFSLIPLHGPAIADGIKAMQELAPNVLEVAVFDTAFHQSIKKEGHLYALPLEFYEKHDVRRYGFHGPSHNYVTQKAAQYLGKSGRFVCCHLGGGASVTAVKDNKSIYTSMGYTPMSGVVMSTRAGDIDPYIPLHIMKTQNKTADEVNTILNKKSGLYGLTDGHTDMRDILSSAENGDKLCQDALDVYVYNIIKNIGSAIAFLGGIDALIFTAGIGEKSAIIREKICHKLEYLGIELDSNQNNSLPVPTKISSANSKVSVLVIPTDEELMMAIDAYNIALEQLSENRKAG